MGHYAGEMDGSGPMDDKQTHIDESIAKQLQRSMELNATIQNKLVITRKALGDIYEQCDNAPTSDCDPSIIAIANIAETALRVSKPS